MAKKPTISKATKKTGAKVEATAREARNWLSDAAKTMKKIDANKLMSSNRPRLLPSNKISRIHVGRMILYFYDPKTKDKMPYWDTFPCVIPIQLYTDSFIGLNLHYLPQGLRKRLLFSLMKVYGDAYLNERKKLQMSYQLLNTTRKHWWFRPCLKKYLYSQVRSRFFIVDPEEWEYVAALPTERFVGANKTRVFADSRKKLGL